MAYGQEIRIRRPITARLAVKGNVGAAWSQLSVKMIPIPHRHSVT